MGLYNINFNGYRALNLDFLNVAFWKETKGVAICEDLWNSKCGMRNVEQIFNKLLMEMTSYG